jgi:hypothetical protein
MGTDGAFSLLFCAAKRSCAFPPNIPAGLRARVSRLGGLTRPFSGKLFPPAGALLFVILMGWWSEHINDFKKVLIAAGRARQHHQQCKGSSRPRRGFITIHATARLQLLEGYFSEG